MPEFDIHILPKQRTVFGFSYYSGKAHYKDQLIDTYEFGIGIGILVLYISFHDKRGAK